MPLASSSATALPPAPGSPPPLLVLRGVRHVYDDDGVAVEALGGVTLAVYPGELVALVGESGSGKSTLLYLMGAMDRPTAGEVILRGRDLGPLSEEERAAVRRREVGFPDELIDAVTLAGTPETCRERLAAYRQAGLALPIVSPRGSGPRGQGDGHGRHPRLRALAVTDPAIVERLSAAKSGTRFEDTVKVAAADAPGLSSSTGLASCAVDDTWQSPIR